jgi:hypothetical protein
VGILAVNDVSLATSWTVLFPALGGEATADLHDNSAVIVLPGSGKLATFTCRHADTTGVRMRISTSSLATDPMLANGFASTVTIDFGTLHDYPAVVLFDSKLWLFCREIPSGGVDAHLRYKTTSDLSAATGWSGTTDLYNNPGKTAYWQINADDDFIHVLTFDDNEADSPDGMNDLKHFKVDAAADRFQSDGDSIAASLPLEPGDIDTITASTGGHHLYNLELFDGKPVATVTVWPSGNPIGSTVVRRLMWDAGWTSTDVLTVADSGLAQGSAVHPDDPNRVFLIRTISGVRDLLEATYDGSWTVDVLAAGVSGDEDWIFPVAARNPGRIKVIVMRGNYDTYLDWTTAPWAIVES